MERKLIPSKILFSAVAEQLAEGRQAVFTVTGMSMWPFLCHDRDQVIVGRAERESLRVGDIVLFRMSEETYLLHRITKLSKETFQTTGDGNLYRDLEMPYGCIVAKVNAVVRKGENIRCSSWRWKCLSRLWISLYPVHAPLLRLLQGIGNRRHRAFADRTGNRRHFSRQERQ